MDEKKPEDKKAINFSIVPDEGAGVSRVYSNFCSIQYSPFDFTLTFCEALPITERELKEAASTHVVKAPIKVRLAVPFQMIPGLINALQENFRLYQESFGPPPPPRGPLH